MKLNPDQDQVELRASVRALLEKTSPLARVREAMTSEQGYDDSVWRRLAGELGIPALAVSEAHGGAGFGLAELALAMEECGAALVPGPLLGSVTSGLVLDAIGADAVLPQIAAGEQTAALVVDPSLNVVGEALSGTATGVAGGATADVLVVVTDEGVYAVDGAGTGVTRTDLVTMDLTRPQATVEFSHAPARRLGSAEGVATGLDRASVALAAESLGVMRRSLELAVEYAKVREQFGRVIGSFQAVKQGLADVYASYELASAAVAYAAWAADRAPDELPAAASLCQAYVLPQAFEAAFQMIQYHGGIGYTWEHDAHLFYKRAKGNETLLGTPERGLERIAAQLLGPIASSGSVR